MKIEKSESGSPIIIHEDSNHKWQVPEYGDIVLDTQRKNTCAKKKKFGFWG